MSSYNVIVSAAERAALERWEDEGGRPLTLREEASHRAVSKSAAAPAVRHDERRGGRSSRHAPVAATI